MIKPETNKKNEEKERKKIKKIQEDQRKKKQFVTLMNTRTGRRSKGSQSRSDTMIKFRMKIKLQTLI